MLYPLWQADSAKGGASASCTSNSKQPGDQPRLQICSDTLPASEVSCYGQASAGSEATP